MKLCVVTDAGLLLCLAANSVVSELKLRFSVITNDLN